ncbi:hypothetical protein [Salinivibrio sp. SS3]|uniref:hypothetical protein n=1 Tax=Salinivibrio sp. SS3 TaxID=1895021 RepID=UPI001C406E3D|nr:hypothetical protein [Salinivibrio sp. BNH]
MFIQTTGVVEESVSRISEYEEKVWFLQLQQPEAVVRSICTWELGDDINLGSLQEAILWVIDSLPNLNARYDLNDGGEAVKYHVSNNSLCLSSVSLGKDIFHYRFSTKGS